MSALNPIDSVIICLRRVCFPTKMWSEYLVTLSLVGFIHVEKFGERGVCKHISVYGDIDNIRQL